jgi:hypothetical protein
MINMAIYKMFPVVEIYDLEKELKTQFDVDIEGELRNILFYDNYQNDCYKSYYFEDDEEFHGDAWEDEEHIRIRNLVNAYLRDTLPDYSRVLIDVTW